MGEGAESLFDHWREEGMAGREGRRVLPLLCGGEVAKLSTDTDTALPSLLSSHSSSSSGFVNGREVWLEMIRIAKNAVSWTKTVHEGLEWDYLRRCILSERIMVSVAPCSPDALTHPPLNEL